MRRRREPYRDENRSTVAARWDAIPEESLEDSRWHPASPSIPRLPSKFEQGVGPHASVASKTYALFDLLLHLTLRVSGSVRRLGVRSRKNVQGPYTLFYPPELGTGWITTSASGSIS